MVKSICRDESSFFLRGLAEARMTFILLSGNIGVSDALLKMGIQNHTFTMPFRDIKRNWLLFTGFGSANLLIPHEILIPESGPGEGESVRSFWMIEDTKSPGNWLLFNRFWRLSLQPDVKWALIQPG